MNNSCKILSTMKKKNCVFGFYTIFIKVILKKIVKSWLWKLLNSNEIRMNLFEKILNLYKIHFLICNMKNNDFHERNVFKGHLWQKMNVLIIWNEKFNN